MYYEKYRCSECGKMMKSASPLAGKEPEGFLSGGDPLQNYYSCINEDCEYFNQKIEMTE